MHDREISQVLLDLKDQLIQAERIRIYEKLKTLTGIYDLPSDAVTLMLHILEDEKIISNKGGAPGDKGGGIMPA